MAQQEMLTNMSCLITGASRGIGHEIALVYASQKAKALYLVARSVDKLNELAKQCTARGAQAVHVLPTDLNNKEEIKKLAENINKISDNYGVDVLVNNAGVNVYGSAISGDIDEWDKCINTNLMAPIVTTRLFTENMVKRQKGTIITIGSIAGVEPMVDNGLYSATKFGIRGWSLHCHRKLRFDNIKVLLVNPGFVATDMVLGRPGLVGSRMIQVADVAEASLLPFRTSSSCCPEEITLRLTKSAFVEDEARM